MNWINIFGLIIVVCMLIPNIIFALSNKEMENKCKSTVMNIMEQIGRYGSMFLMVFNIGIAEFGFRSEEDFVIWLTVSFALLLLYWVFWLVYFRKRSMSYAMALAIIPSAIFIFNGYILRHYLLLAFGLIFTIGHSYVTYENNHE